MQRHNAYKNKYAYSGQALILVVLIMFLLLGLSGVFVAVISNSFTVSVRASDRARLTTVVLNGFTYATNNLLSSSQGADWIPDLGPDNANPGWIKDGNGFYKVDISYGSNTSKGDSDLWFESENDKYVKIDVNARYVLDNEPNLQNVDEEEKLAYEKAFRSGKRYLHRRIVAFMPIGLTDNIMWITNKDNSPEPTVLGSTLWLKDINLIRNANGTGGELAGEPYEDADPANPAAFYPRYTGSVRANSDLMPANIHLELLKSPLHNVARRDNITISGKLLDNSSYGFISKLFDEPKAFISGMDFISSNALVIDSIKNPLLETMQAPSIADDNFARYRYLTRDSGEWPSDHTHSVNPAHYGRGDGIYINNPDHIQFGGNLDKLHKDFLNIGSNEADSCWINGNYDPFGAKKAVEIILKEYFVVDNEANPTKAISTPKIQLRCDTPIFYDLVRDELVETITIDYPKNGVIFAEGNIVVRGNLPASRNMDSNYYNIAPATGEYLFGGRVGGADYEKDASDNYTNNLTSIEYYRSDLNRRYDLTIVSGGTIYVDGNLESPATRKVSFKKKSGDTEDTIKSGDPYDSKLALLAADDVVLNPTNYITYSGDTMDMTTIDGKGWVIDNSSLPFEINFRLSGSNAGMVFWFKGAGDGSLYDPAAYSIMNMSVNGNPYIFNDDVSLPEIEKASYYFGSELAKDSYFNWLNPLSVNWSQVMTPPSVIWQNIIVGGTPGDPGSFPAINPSDLLDSGELNKIRFTLGNGSTTGYYLAVDDKIDAATPTNFDIIVDALIYAERGSWFIIPGAYFNDDSDMNTVPEDVLIAYRESPDARIYINGAINVNRFAGVEYESEWLKHWRGKNSNYYGPDGDLDPVTSLDPYDGISSWKLHATIDMAYATTGISYTYDPGIIRPVCYDVDGNGSLVRYYPRLPKLPVSPSIIAYGMSVN